MLVRAVQCRIEVELLKLQSLKNRKNNIRVNKTDPMWMENHKFYHDHAKISTHSVYEMTRTLLVQKDNMHKLENCSLISTHQR